MTQDDKEEQGVPFKDVKAAFVRQGAVVVPMRHTSTHDASQPVAESSGSMGCPEFDGQADMEAARKLAARAATEGKPWKEVRETLAASDEFAEPEDPTPMVPRL